MLAPRRSNPTLMSFTCTSAAPSIAGIERRKLYLATSSLSKPRKRPADIVAPEREIPGAMARACAHPIMSELRTPSFSMDSFSLTPLLTLSDPHSSRPVTMRKKPTATVLLNRASKKSHHNTEFIFTEERSDPSPLSPQHSPPDKPLPG